MEKKFIYTKQELDKAIKLKRDYFASKIKRT